MPDVLTAEQIHAEQRSLRVGDKVVLAEAYDALARSHEALRGECLELEADREIRMRGQFKLQDERDAAQWQAGIAADALRAIAEGTWIGPVGPFAREALAVLGHATPAAADEERQA